MPYSTGSYFHPLVFVFVSCISWQISKLQIWKITAGKSAGSDGAFALQIIGLHHVVQGTDILHYLERINFNHNSNYKCDFICILFLTQNQDLISSQIFSMNYIQRLFLQTQLAWYFKRQGKEDKEAPSMVNYQKPGSSADQHG